MKKRIKKHDMFGHSVVLNFNRSGDKFNTVPGGLVSIAVSIFLALFLVLKVQALVGRGENKYGLMKQLVEDGFEGIKLENQGFLIYMTVGSFTKPVPDINEL